jgi:hypothetical protein
VSVVASRVSHRSAGELGLERLGDHLDRPLFALALAGFGLPAAPLELPTRHFLCLLAADFSAASDGQISALAKELLDRGASYFVCWGPGCERAHDLIDDVTLLVEPPVPGDSVIMTTWHAGQPLGEALLFLLCAAWPDAAYEETTGCALAVSIGSPAIAAEIREALAHPDSFIAKWCA